MSASAERRAAWLSAVCAALCALWLWAAPSSAAAGTARVTPYAMDRVWPAAVRFLRVDLSLEITEKDADAGYVIFKYIDDKKPYKGTLELSRTTQDSREATRLSLHIVGRPGYLEEALLDKLDTKLKDELGDPPSATAPGK